MGKSSSSDLRVRIVGEIESGHSCRAAARRFGVSAATAVRLAQRSALSLYPWRGSRAQFFPAFRTTLRSAVTGGSRPCFDQITV
jgi:transposase-like protein